MTAEYSGDHRCWAQRWPSEPAENPLLEQRLALVQAIADCWRAADRGGQFCLPKGVPAMAGTDQVLPALDAAEFVTPTIALIPNMKGYELARNAGAKTCDHGALCQRRYGAKKCHP